MTTNNAGLIKTDSVIARLSGARTALAEAKTIQETKKILDVAAAAEIYARRQELGEEAIGYAHAIKIEALSQLGRLLDGMEKRGPQHSKGGGSKGSTREPLPDAPPTIANLGITKKTSMVAQQLAALPAETREEIAQREKTLTEAIRLSRRSAKQEAPPLPTGKFRIFYADPPWKYGDGREALEGTTGASAHYPSMSITELCALPIEEMADDNAVLFLWVTSPLLEECFPVIKAWGFKYKTSFVWDKVKHNMGHYNSVRHEFLLVCTRGSCLPDVGVLHDSVLTIPRGQHSEKPQEFRAIIDEIYTHGNRIELFARGDYEGWAVWGNEKRELRAV